MSVMYPSLSFKQCLEFGLLGKEHLTFIEIFRFSLIRDCHFPVDNCSKVVIFVVVFVTKKKLQKKKLC